MTDERDERNEMPENDRRNTWMRPEDIRTPGGGLFGEDAYDGTDFAEKAPDQETAPEAEAISDGTAEGETVTPEEPAQETAGPGEYTFTGTDAYYGEPGQGSGYTYGGSLRYEDDDRYGTRSANAGATQKDSSRRRRGGRAVFAVLLAAIFGLCAGLGAWGAGALLKSQDSQSASVTEAREPEKEAVPETQDKEQAKTTEEVEAPQFVTGNSTVPSTQISEVAEFVMPSIVSVYNNYIAEQYYFGHTYQQSAVSTGSGIIIAATDSELLIATNNHVVEGSESLKVRFVDETEAEANLKGTDAANDLAVIAVSMDSLSQETRDAITVATLGSSETLKVGQDAIAIGNALGYGQSVTRGIISAVNRQINTEDGITGTFIQTDAAINPGNSGGALVNINGEVIGINSSKIGGSTVEGMGFAIPISEAMPIIENLMNRQTRMKGAADSQGTLGISGTTVNEETQRYYGMPGGVYVAQILEGGAAEESDLQKGDIITSIDDTEVTSMDALKKQLEYYEAGTTVTLTVMRMQENGEYKQTQIDLTLGTQAILTEQTEEGRTQEKQEEGSAGDGSLFEGQRPDTGRGFDFSTEGEGPDFSWPFGNTEEDEGDR